MLIHAAICRYIYHYGSHFYSPYWKLHFTGNRVTPCWTQVTMTFSVHRQGHLKTYLFFKGLKGTALGLDRCEGMYLSLTLSYCHNLDQWKQLIWGLAGIKRQGTANRMFFVGTQSSWNWFPFPDPEELKFYGLHSMLHSSYFFQSVWKQENCECG